VSTIAPVFTNVDRAIRALRRKKRWTQQALGDRAGVSRETISRLERGRARGLPLGTLERIAEALGATVRVEVRWHGARLDRLLDAAHASVQQATADLLTAVGWIVRVEVSFNHYGDRGRIDILAHHPGLRVLLVVEIKSALGDLQDTLGRLGVKTRVGRHVARELGWTGAAAPVPVLVIGDSRRARRIVTSHEALFARYALRGRAAISWLRRPSEPMPSGLLWFANGPYSHGVTTRRGKRPAKPPDSHVA
jgi:transcriptional regulator with XRE-family HTH domain